jgi:hypothetical protein
VGGDEARMGNGRDVYRVLVGRTKGKRPPGRPRRLSWTLGRQGSMRRTRFTWLRIGSSGGLL